MQHDGDGAVAQHLRSLFTLPKWRAFLESIAKSLSVTLLYLDPDGQSYEVGNSGHGGLATAGSGPPSGRARPRMEWLAQVAKAASRSRPFETMADPSGAPVGLIAFDGVFLGVSSAPSPDRELFKQRCRALHAIFGQLMSAVGDSAELSRHAVVLSAVDLLNSLILKLYSSADFDLTRVLELVANSLVIVLDAPGAWAMSWSPGAGGLAAVSGAQRDLLLPLARQWQCLTGPSREPLQELEATNQAFFASRPICHSRIVTAGATLWVGVLQPEDTHARKCLESLAGPVAIAAAIHGTHGLLKRRLGSVLEAISQPLIVTDGAGSLMIANSSARLLLDLMGITAQPGALAAGLGLSDSIARGVADALLGRSSGSELDYSRGRAIRWKATPLRDEGGEVSGAMLLLDDITEIVAFRDQARDWDKLVIVGQLAAGMAHEIRSPLAAAMGAIQLVLGGHANGREDEILERLTGELARMNRVLSGYLDLGKPGGALRISNVNVLDVLAEIEFLLYSDAVGHGVALRYDMPPRPVWVAADTGALKQVCINLAKNAVEAMAGEGGCLDVCLAAADGQAQIIFTDTGPGISPELKEQVFRPFFTTKPQGTGLGLSVSRELVTRMGGTLSLATGPGSGVRAIVSLPLLEPAAPEANQ